LNVARGGGVNARAGPDRALLPPDPLAVGGGVNRRIAAADSLRRGSCVPAERADPRPPDD
jgi:hypothetical protein